MGVISDQCQHPYGRRFPFVWYGALLTTVLVTLLPRSSDICDLVFGGVLSERHLVLARGFLAITILCALNIAIQPLQMGLRALVCESCPPEKCVDAAAFASTLTCLGGVFGYGIATRDLPSSLPVLGSSQFKCTGLVVGTVLILTVATTLFLADPRSSNRQRSHGGRIRNQTRPSALQHLRKLYRTLCDLPEDMKVICRVQFCAWLSWCPFLYYVTT